ncbi:N-acetylmuramoyl-L-alanine amidase [Acidobacteriota bacterium]
MFGKKYHGFVLFFIFSLFSFAVHPNSNSNIEIHNVRPYTHPTYTRIVIDIGKLREYSHNKLPSPDRIYVDIYQTRLNPILHGKTFHINNNYINQIRIAQKTSSSVRLVVDLEFEKIENYRVFHLPDPFRIVIDIYPDESGPDSSPVITPPSPKPTKSGYTIIRQLGLGVKRVVIDPGHGGADPGCVGKLGSFEKNIVIDISKRLKDLLVSKNHLEVILTRESDIFMPPENRTVIANQKHADIFISIHANSNPSKRLNGVETFYLNFSKDPSVNTIAARENATSTKNISEMKDIIERIAKNSKIVESKDLAEKIHNNLVSRISKTQPNIKNLGFKGGPFWVLIGGKMPSVLVEVSHLSNLKEETRLKTSQYRQHIAQGIYDGIIEYMHSLGKG